MGNFPDDPSEFGRQWSSCAGELHGFKQAITELEKRCAESFVRKQDDIAHVLRDAAIHLRTACDRLSVRVDEFIKENRRRDFEIHKKCGVK